jgi:hypothetical protein
VENPNWLGKPIDGDTLIPLISHLSYADKFSIDFSAGAADAQRNTH